MGLHKLIIHRLYFTETDCYKTAPTRKVEGVQVHCTVSGNPYLKRYVQPDDGLLGKNKYNNSHNRPNISVCASAYIGKLADGTVAVYQTLPWDKRTWLSGNSSKGNANKQGYIGFETCCVLEDESYFKDAVMEKAILLVAYWCKEFGFKPYDEGPCGLRVMDHSELHRAGYASNHADITNWLKVYGMTMNDFRNKVEQVLEEGIDVNIVEAKTIGHPTLRKGDQGPEVRYMQELLAKAGSKLTVDGIFGTGTFNAVKAFQNKNGLTADGIVGPATWSKLIPKDEELPFVPDVDIDESIKAILKNMNDLTTLMENLKANIQALSEALKK